LIWWGHTPGYGQTIASPVHGGMLIALK